MAYDPVDKTTFCKESSIHGVNEATMSPVKHHRYVWIAVMGVAFIAMAYQLLQVAISFVGDETGTRRTGYLPSNMPGVMICPRFHAFKPNAEIAKETGRYFNGYFIYGTEVSRAIASLKGTEENPGTPEVIMGVEALIRSFNSSLETFIRANAFDKADIIRKTEILPPIDERWKFDSLYTALGLCYLFQLEADIDAKLAQFVTLYTALSDQHTPISIKEMNALYILFVGNFDTLAVNPPIAGKIYLPKNNRANVKIRITKKVRYPGRQGNRCRNYKKSDENHCIGEYVNLHFCDRCIVETPTSSSYAKSTGKPEDLCNYYHPERFPCLSLLTSSQFKEIDKACPPPCEEEVFDYTSQMSTGNETGVILSFDNLALSAAMVEYPLVTLADFLSSTGGTMGLYFGASLISIFQILFYCGVTSKSCCRGRKADTPRYTWK